MKIEIEQEEQYDLFVTLWGNGGIVREPDGRIRLWYKPF